MYYNKYLKYKNKYLILKGGSHHTINIVKFSGEKICSVNIDNLELDYFDIKDKLGRNLDSIKDGPYYRIIDDNMNTIYTNFVPLQQCINELYNLEKTKVKLDPRKPLTLISNNNNKIHAYYEKYFDENGLIKLENNEGGLIDDNDNEDDLIDDNEDDLIEDDLIEDDLIEDDFDDIMMATMLIIQNNSKYTQLSSNLQENLFFNKCLIARRVMWIFEYMSKEMINDYSIIKLALKIDTVILNFISEELKKKEDFVKLVISTYDKFNDNVDAEFIFSKFKEILKKNEAILELAISKNGLAIQYGDSSKENYKKLAKIAVKNNPYAFSYIKDKLCDDIDFMIELILENNEVLKKMVEDYLYNEKTEQFFSEIVKRNHDILKYVPDEYKQGVLKNTSV